MRRIHGKGDSPGEVVHCRLTKRAFLRQGMTSGGKVEEVVMLVDSAEET